MLSTGKRKEIWYNTDWFWELAANTHWTVHGKMNLKWSFLDLISHWWLALCCGLYVVLWTVCFFILILALDALKQQGHGLSFSIQQKAFSTGFVVRQAVNPNSDPPPHKIIAHTVTSLPESYFMLTLQIPPKVLLFFHLQYHHLV